MLRAGGAAILRLKEPRPRHAAPEAAARARLAQSAQRAITAYLSRPSDDHDIEFLLGSLLFLNSGFPELPGLSGFIVEKGRPERFGTGTVSRRGDAGPALEIRGPLLL